MGFSGVAKLFSKDEVREPAKDLAQSRHSPQRLSFDSRIFLRPQQRLRNQKWNRLGSELKFTLVDEEGSVAERTAVAQKVRALRLL
jgi:hypothetical protein